MGGQRISPRGLCWTWPGMMTGVATRTLSRRHSFASRSTCWLPLESRTSLRRTGWRPAMVASVVTGGRSDHLAFADSVVAGSALGAAHCSSVRVLEWDRAAAMALVLSHEGHIAGMERELDRLRTWALEAKAILEQGLVTE